MLATAAGSVLAGAPLLAAALAATLATFVWSALRSLRPSSRGVRTAWVHAFLADACSSAEESVRAMSEALDACEAVDSAQCAEQMREVVRAGHIRYDALETDPCIALRCSRHARSFNGAIYARFVVQYNVYAGSIVALGSAAQRQELYDTQSAGSLGCFAFTELSAGVITGIKVETTATYNSETRTFLIDSCGGANAKNWINQGLSAEHAVILATAIVGGVNRGPHLFFARIQQSLRRGDGSLMLHPSKGVAVAPMPPMNGVLGLDYARIEFRAFEVPASCLLSRYSGVGADGSYFLSLPEGCRRMTDLLMDRLVAGRVCLSEYALAYAKNAMRVSWAHACERTLPPMGRSARARPMSELPLVLDFFYRYGRTLATVARYVARTREALIEGMALGTLSDATQEASCVSKFVGASVAVDVLAGLRKVIGSFSLSEASRLGSDCFVCNGICFAEGDNSVMELKVVGDVVRGKSAALPRAFLVQAALDSRSRRVLAAYLARLAYAFCLGAKKAMDEGQLLKDIAWARAHLLIACSGEAAREGWAEYCETAVHFPARLQI